MSENPTAIAIWRQHDGQAANGRACVVWRSGHLPMLDGSQRASLIDASWHLH